MNFISELNELENKMIVFDNLKDFKTNFFDKIIESKQTKREL